MLVHYIPKPPGIRVGRHAFKHQSGGTIGQRPIDNIGMAGHPTDIGSAPVNIPGLVIKHHFMGIGRIDHIAASGVQHAFGFAGGAGGIENEKRVFGGHFFRHTFTRSLVHGGKGVNIQMLVPLDFIAGGFENENAGDIMIGINF